MHTHCPKCWREVTVVFLPGEYATDWTCPYPDCVTTRIYLGPAEELIAVKQGHV